MKDNKEKKKYGKPTIKTEKVRSKRYVIAQGCDKCPSAQNRLNLLQCKQGVTRFY